MTNWKSIPHRKASKCTFLRIPCKLSETYIGAKYGPQAPCLYPLGSMGVCAALGETNDGNGGPAWPTCWLSSFRRPGPM